MKEFIIPFFGLKNGKHEFNYHIDHLFFEAFETTLIEDTVIEVDVILEKSSTMLLFAFKAKGVDVVPCDRCGELFDLTISTKDNIIVKFGDESFEQTDEIVILSHDTHEIDISQYIYEMIVLGIPNKRVHPAIEDCNQEVLKRLESFKGEHKEMSDPRWDALRKLK